MTPDRLLTQAVADDPARPLITFYDDSTGERVELSVVDVRQLGRQDRKPAGGRPGRRTGAAGVPGPARALAGGGLARGLLGDRAGERARGGRGRDSPHRHRGGGRRGARRRRRAQRPGGRARSSASVWDRWACRGAASTFRRTSRSTTTARSMATATSSRPPRGSAPSGRRCWPTAPLHSAAELGAATTASLERWGLPRGARILSVLPFDGLPAIVAGLLGPLANGGGTVLCRRTDPGRLAAPHRGRAGERGRGAARGRGPRPAQVDLDWQVCPRVLTTPPARPKDTFLVSPADPPTDARAPRRAASAAATAAHRPDGDLRRAAGDRVGRRVRRLLQDQQQHPEPGPHRAARRRPPRR